MDADDYERVDRIVGDLSNLFGAYLTHQLPNVLYTSVYFVLMDLIVILQYFYYARVRIEEILPLATDFMYSPSIPPSRRSVSALSIPVIAIAVSSVRAFTDVWSHELPPACNAAPSVSDQIKLCGAVLSWLSALFYVFSRIPQCLENYMKKNVEGLSLHLFLLTVIGNVCVVFGAQSNNVALIWIIHSLPIPRV